MRRYRRHLHGSAEQHADRHISYSQSPCHLMQSIISSYDIIPEHVLGPVTSTFLALSRPTYLIRALSFLRILSAFRNHPESRTELEGTGYRLTAALCPMGSCLLPNSSSLPQALRHSPLTHISASSDAWVCIREVPEAPCMC